MARAIFWLSFVFVLYVYFGYPLLLMAWRRMRPRPVKKKRAFEPAVSVVIAARNERSSIEARLKNCFALDYPKRKLQIIVSLDGPTDGTEFVVWKYAAHGVEVVYSKEHSGKAAALNRALRRAAGRIVVFADARQTFDRNAIRELVANFADESVGAVSGELVLVDETQQEAGTDVGLYWRYEKAIRSMESDVHSVPGATGAIYAIRRELYRDLPAVTLLDDVMTPLNIVLSGHRAVFDPTARAYDRVACCPRDEYRRKVRTLCGNYQLIAQMPQTLLPFRNPIFIQFVSHKAGRLIAPWALAALFVTSLLMAHERIYAAAFALQALFYGCAAAGHLLSRRGVAPPVLVADERRAA